MIAHIFMYAVVTALAIPAAVLIIGAFLKDRRL